MNCFYHRQAKIGNIVLYTLSMIKSMIGKHEIALHCVCRLFVCICEVARIQHFTFPLLEKWSMFCFVSKNMPHKIVYRLVSETDIWQKNRSATKNESMVCFTLLVWLVSLLSLTECIILCLTDANEVKPVKLVIIF